MTKIELSNVLIGDISDKTIFTIESIIKKFGGVILEETPCCYIIKMGCNESLLRFALSSYGMCEIQIKSPNLVSFDHQLDIISKWYFTPKE